MIGTTSSPNSATRPCAGRTKCTLVQPSASWYCITFGIGKSASALSSAFCKPCASVAPVTTLSKNSASALPSIWRFKRGTSAALAPALASFLSSAGARASPERPSATRRSPASASATALVGRLRATCVRCAASRRGDANGVTLAWSVISPCDFRLSARPRSQTPRPASSAPSAAAPRRTARRAGCGTSSCRSGRLLQGDLRR